MQKAFTLIELAIVLVIIGLLAAGVMVGRTMFRQSQVMSVMVDTRTYIAAIEAFQKKYNALPGDMANATSFWGAAAGTVGTNYTTDCYTSGSATSPATCNGDGNGKIDNFTVYSNEVLRMWQHLANAGFIQGSYTGTGSSNVEHVLGVNVPKGKLINSGFGFAYEGTKDTLNPWLFEGVYNHIMDYGGFVANAGPAAPILTGSEAQSIDSKFDDGFPALGQIRTWRSGNWGTSCPTTNVASTALYTKTTGLVCSLVIISGF